MQCDPDLLIADSDLSLLDGAVGGKLGRYLTKGKGFYELLLIEVARSHKIRLELPFNKLTAAQRALLLFGEGARPSYTTRKERSGASYTSDEEYTSDWPGLCGHVDAWHAKAADPGWVDVLEAAIVESRACSDDLRGVLIEKGLLDRERIDAHVRVRVGVGSRVGQRRVAHLR